MLSDRLSPIDLPAQPSATCPDCGYRADYKAACELESKCPKCGEWLESDDD